MDKVYFAPVLLLLSSSLAIACGSSDKCYDCGEAKPAAYVLTGAAECPSSVGLTRASLLDGLKGTFTGASPAPVTDAGADTNAASTGMLTLNFTTPTGDVICQPSYASGIGGMQYAEVETPASLTLETSDHKFVGTVSGTVHRTSSLPDQRVPTLRDIKFEAYKIEPSTLGYTPKPRTRNSTSKSRSLRAPSWSLRSAKGSKVRTL